MSAMSSAPLTTVRMAADLIYDHSSDLDPTLRRSTELLVGELDQFETLLNDLLEISRHDAGVAELSVEAVDLRSTVNSALSNVGHLADETGIELQVELPEHEVIAEVDARRVERILRNLIANAIDHAEHKPVRIRMAADGTPSPSPFGTMAWACGRGGKAGVQPLLAFGSVAGPAIRGTGLGLAISIEDARLHRGRLEAWGEPGKGVFPADPAAGPRAQGHHESLADETCCRRTPTRPCRGDAVIRRLVIGTMAGLIAVLPAGCAGVPNSSAPQAIGTVERPAPKSLPEPSPAMDPMRCSVSSF